VSADLGGRVPDSTVEKAATRAALQSLLEYHDSYSRELEREQSSLALLCQHTLCLRGQEEEQEEEEEGEEREKKEEAEEEEEEEDEMERKAENRREGTPCLREIQSMQEQYKRYTYYNARMLLHKYLCNSM